MPVASRLDRHGAAGSSARSSQAEGARERAHRRLVDRRLDVGMAYAVRCRRLEAGAPVAEVVEIGAGHDRRLGARRDRAVQVGLAEEAAVGRVGEVVGVGELAGIDDRETPAFAARMVLDASGRLRRHRGRYRVHHLRAATEPASCRHGERHAVDAAAHRDRDRRRCPRAPHPARPTSPRRCSTLLLRPPVPALRPRAAGSIARRAHRRSLDPSPPWRCAIRPGGSRS